MAERRRGRWAGLSRARESGRGGAGKVGGAERGREGWTESGREEWAGLSRAREGGRSAAGKGGRGQALVRLVEKGHQKECPAQKDEALLLEGDWQPKCYSAGWRGAMRSDSLL